jgi:uncharacterized protein (DUF2147 family)
MKNLRRTFATLALAFISFYAFAQNLSPVGFWNTVDDKTGDVLSVVQIYAETDGSLSGKIIKIMPVLGQKTTDICKGCNGTQKNAPILGMKIMWGMMQTADDPLSFDSGRVLDPKSGNIYRGKMTLSADNDSLTLRGYVLMPMLGRSEIWTRTISP